MANEKRLIDKMEAVKLLRGKCVAKYPNSFLMGLLASATEIEQMPTVEAVEVVHGRWIWGTSNHHEWMKCSECLVSQTPTGVFTYCPNCGARMDGEPR